MTKMLIDRAVVEQALEALTNCTSEYGHRCNRCDSEVDEGGKVVEALRAALAEQQEPVGQMGAMFRTHPAVELQRSVESAVRPACGVDPVAKAKTGPLTAEPVQAEPVASFDEVWNAIDWDEWRNQPIRELVRMIHSKTNPEAALAEQQEPVAWLRVIDEAMVTHHLGVADPADDYETAKRKMNILLCMAQDIGKHFAKQAEPVQEPVAKVELMMTGGNAGLATRIVEIDDHLRERLRPGQLLYTAPPQRKPLTEEEILKAVGWDRAEMYMKLTPNFPVAEAKKETLKNARAIERAHGIGEQP